MSVIRDLFASKKFIAAMTLILIGMPFTLALMGSF